MMEISRFKWLTLFGREVVTFFKRNKQVLKVFVIACSIFFATSFFYFHNSQPQGDEPHYLILSQTILKYHSIEVMKDYTHHDYNAIFPGTIDPHVEFVQGKYLPVRRVGGPVLWLPFFAWEGRLGAIFFISLLSALTVVNIYKLLEEHGIRKHIASLVALSYAFASPLYVYSHLTFIEPIGALFVIYLFRKAIQKEVLGKYEIIASSILLGILPFVHIRFVFIGLPIAVMLFLKLFRSKTTKRIDILLFLVPASLLFILLETFTFYYWHSFNPAAPEIINGEQSNLSLIAFGLLGLLFDQEYGVLFTFPIFLYFFIGIFLTLKEKLFKINLQILAISVIYILVFTSFPDWKGGWSPPARYILVLMPIFSYYIGFTLQKLQNVICWGIYKLFLAIGFTYVLFTMFAPASGFNVENGISVTFLYLQTHTGIDFTRVLPTVFKPHQTSKFLFWTGITIGLMLIIISSNKFMKFLELD